MKKFFIMVLMFGLALSGCALPFLPQQTEAVPTPFPEEGLQATAEILSQQTLEALATPTLPPTETPVISTPTHTAIPNTPTETQNPVLLTLTATLGTGTVSPDTTGTPGVEISGTLPFTGTPGNGTVTSTIQPGPLSYGTLPPNLPYGEISLVNKAKADAYISLRCVTKSGAITILEYPVKRTVAASAPAGEYTYVAWVGGRQFTGSFSLREDGSMTITLFKDKVTIAKK